MSNQKERCPDCGVEPGQLHQQICDVELCPTCGDQLLSCGCTTADVPRMPWTGEWPGFAECREFAWYAKVNPDGPGWIPCAADDPEASPDLNRLHAEAVWDPVQKRFLKPAATDGEGA